MRRMRERWDFAISEAVVSPERRERRVARIWDCGGGETGAAASRVGEEEAEARDAIVLEPWSRRKGRRVRERGGCKVDSIAC